MKNEAFREIYIYRTKDKQNCQWDALNILSNELVSLGSILPMQPVTIITARDPKRVTSLSHSFF